MLFVSAASKFMVFPYCFDSTHGTDRIHGNHAFDTMQCPVHAGTLRISIAKFTVYLL